MDTETVKFQLTQPESATLEFKRKLYALDHEDTDIRERQRGELIKDILSLANGSPTTVEDKVNLIIGADDKRQPDGSRKLYEVEAGALTQQRVLHLVNAACTPGLQDIEVDEVPIEGKRLLVITIWPTPHLHETTRPLLTDKKHPYNEHTVFIRRDENIGVANQREREVLLKLKQIHFADTRKAPPVTFGAIVAAMVGALMAGAAAHKDKSKSPTNNETTSILLAGSIVSAPLGALIGWIFEGFLETRYEWHFLSNRKRLALVFGSAGFMVVFWRVYKALWLMLANLASKANDSGNRQGGT